MAAIAAEFIVPFGTSFVVFCEEDETCVSLRPAFLDLLLMHTKKILSLIKTWRLQPPRSLRLSVHHIHEIVD